jgi:hypothetical protein
MVAIEKENLKLKDIRYSILDIRYWGIKIKKN